MSTEALKQMEAPQALRDILEWAYTYITSCSEFLFACTQLMITSGSTLALCIGYFLSHFMVLCSDHRPFWDLWHFNFVSLYFC